MKRIFIFLLGGMAIFLLGGCQRPVTKPGNVEVLIEGNGQFPEFLAGTWKDNEHGWEFVFEPDGSISSVVLTLGRIRIKPGEITKVPLIKGGQGVFEPDQWIIHYNPASRELTAKIALKNFRMQVADNILEGKCTDILMGPVSKDGKSWIATWTSFPNYTAYTPENPNFKLAADQNYGVETPLILEKVTKSD
jgi:hypothetical protein